MKTMDRRFRPKLAKTEPRKFILVGVPRSGVGLVYTVLNSDTRITCHSEILAGSQDLTNEMFDDRRRKAHEAYFGAPRRFNPSSPAHLSKNNPNMHRYLMDMLLSHPTQSETALGVRLDYATVDSHDLYELFSEPDITVIHVTRNPVACFTSYEQAKQSGVWKVKLGEKTGIPPAVRLDLEELVQFVQQYETVRRKISSYATRLLEMSFNDIARNYVGAIYRLYRALGYEDGIPTYRQTQRLPNVTLARRITNYAALVTSAPSLIRDYLEHEYLGG